MLKETISKQKEQIGRCTHWFISDGLDDDTFVVMVIDGPKTFDGYGDTMENMSYMWDSW